MAITRRQFLKRTGLAAAGTVLGPGLFANPFVRRAFAETIGDRYFVVVFLNGGNDGLNTVVPYDNGGGSLRTAYDVARLTGGGGLRLSPGSLLTIGTDPNTGAQLGLHPGLGGLKAIYDAGRLAVIQGCGYPEPSLSHEQSRNIWESGSRGATAGTGWVGRHLAVNYTGSQIPAVNISESVVGEYRQNVTSVLALRRLADFGFPYDEFAPGDAAAKEAAFQALYAAATGGAHPTQINIGDTGSSTLQASKDYPPLHGNYVSARSTWNEAYAALDTGFARDLREVAKVIYGVSTAVPGVNARFFQVHNGGFDTHADQGGGAPGDQHYDLLSEIGDALKVFYDDCTDMGLADKVCVVVWSEFSRRIMQNDNGTDHGSQGPMLVLGGTVVGGVYGSHPNIDELALDEEGNTIYTQDANPYRSTDFRDVYGTLLKHWVNMLHPDILSNVLTLEGGPAAEYWTVENFDLPFLP